MKKLLPAVALAAALPATALAQSSVTLYGIADAGIGWSDGDASGGKGTMVVESGYQATSRIGIRGTEDLGGGLKAVFNLESGIKLDTGESDATGFWQRRAVVGLAGRFGEVVVGRDYTPGYKSAGLTDVMSYGLYGNWASFHTGANGITIRASNGVHYAGKFGGLTLRAAWAEGEVAQPGSSGDIYGVAADWKSGPLVMQGYYQEINNAAGDAVKQAGIGAGYRFDGLRLTVSWGLADNPGSIRSATNIRKTQGLGLGAGIRVGAGEVLAQLIRLDRSMVAGGDAKATVFGIAYVHPLSKRTNLYANIGMTKNNRNAAFALRASGTGIAAGGLGSDPRGIALGVKHTF